MTAIPQPQQGVGLGREDLPGLYVAADAASARGQKAYRAATASRGLLAVLAALLSALAVGAQRDELLFAVAVAFVGALVVESWLWAARPERRWYDGRALAESAKTLAWRYAVGADPFPIRRVRAERELLARLSGLLRDAPETGIAPTDGPAVSDAMRHLRVKSLEVRRQAYLANRLEDQRRWYRDKAEFHGRHAARWRVTLLTAEAVGVVVALARAIGWLTFDLAGVVATIVTAAAAWLAVRQHESAARAYTFAHGELSIASERLRSAKGEDDWAKEAADAEEAISREHTMWRASRSGS